MLLVTRVYPAVDRAEDATDLWDVRIGLPFWFVGIDGDVGVLNRSVGVDEGVGDIFDNLDFAMPLNTEVRYCGHWLFFANGIYTKTGFDAEPGRLLGLGVDEMRLTQRWLNVDFGVGYNLFPKKQFRLEPFVGGRVTWLEAELSLAVPGLNPEFGDSKAWADPIIGLMLEFPAYSTFSLFAEADIGGFGVSSDLTWQVNAGGEVDIGKHVYVRLSYRHLSMDYEDGGFLYDVVTSGPQLEIGVRL